MSFEEEIADLQKQLAEAEKSEQESADKPNDTDDEAEESGEETASQEENTVEVEEKPSQETVQEEFKPDASAYARMRREKAASDRKVQELTDKIEKLLAQNTAPASQNTQETVSQTQTDPFIEEMKREHTLSRAEREFKGLENQFKATVADYGDVADAYSNAIYQSIRVQNPRASQDQLAEMTKQTILHKASQFAIQGLNPVEELYHEALDLGFKAVPKAQEKTDEEKKPDLNKIAANKNRSAGMAGAAGRGGGQMTFEQVANLPVDEFMKLPKEERDRWTSGSYAR